MREDLEQALAEVDPAALGRRLKQARLAAGLTQPELGGERASAAYLSRVERGQRRPSPPLLEHLCERLGLSVELAVLGEVAPDVRQMECEVGFAEIALATGSVDEAAQRVAALEAGAHGVLPTALAHRTVLVRAGVEAARGEIAAAIATCGEVVDADPDAAAFASASLRMTRLLRESGDVGRSIIAGEQALTRMRAMSTTSVDDVVRLTVTVAAAYWESGRVDRALQLCRGAIEESERASSPAAKGAAYWNTAVIESEAGNIEEAVLLTRRALVLFETDSDLRLYSRLRTHMAEMLIRSDPPETDEALELLADAGRALALSSADAIERLHHHMATARARYVAGDLEAARTAAETCLAAPGVQPFVAAGACGLLGRIAFEEGRLDDARAHFRESAARLTAAGGDRRAAQLWFSLAGMFDEAGMAEEAKDAYRRAAASTGLATTLGRAGVRI